MILRRCCTWIFNPLAASGRRKPKSLSRHLNRYLLVHHFRRQFSLHIINCQLPQPTCSWIQTHVSWGTRLIIKGYFILHLSSILSTSRVCRNTFFRLGSLKSTLMSSLGTPITPAQESKSIVCRWRGKSAFSVDTCYLDQGGLAH